MLIGLAIFLIILYAIAVLLISYSIYRILKDPIIGTEGLFPFTIGYSFIALVLSVPIILSYIVGHKINYYLFELFSVMFVVGLAVFILGQLKAKEHNKEFLNN